MVARLLWEQDVGGSNPSTPTIRASQVSGEANEANEANAAFIQWHSGGLDHLKQELQFFRLGNDQGIGQGMMRP